ncbi:MAG: hypothetical protein IJV87_09485 [Clostridia bacterium]|nr:hypothetical protein [Clostridia bacterium]
MKYEIELITQHDVQEFTSIVQKVPSEVRLSGKDEHGAHWELSAKSMLCVLLLGGHIQHRHHASQDIDWNAIYCECEKDIYPLIKKFVKE